MVSKLQRYFVNFTINFLQWRSLTLFWFRVRLRVCKRSEKSVMVENVTLSMEEQWKDGCRSYVMERNSGENVLQLHISAEVASGLRWSVKECSGVLCCTRGVSVFGAFGVFVWRRAPRFFHDVRITRKKCFKLSHFSGRGENLLCFNTIKRCSIDHFSELRTFLV